MLDLLPLLLSATTKTILTVDRRDACSVPSPTTAEVAQNPSAHSVGHVVPPLTFSSDSAPPLTLPDSSSSSVGHNSGQWRQSSVTKSNSNNSNSRGKNNGNGEVTVRFNDNTSTSVGRCALFSTPPPPLLRPASIEEAAERKVKEGGESSNIREDFRRRLHHKVQSTAVSTTATATAVGPKPPALASLKEVSSVASASEVKMHRVNQSATPILQPVLTDTAFALNHAAVVAAAAAVTATAATGAVETTTGLCNTQGLSHAESASGRAEANWVEYEVYLRLSAALLPQRALQDRVAQLCCAMSSGETTAAKNSEERRLVCIDNVLPFLTHGGDVASPPAFESDLHQTISSTFNITFEIQQVCFPLFCLLGAKHCAVAEHSFVIRSIHTPAPPVFLDMALRPQRENNPRNRFSASRKQKNEVRLHVLLLFPEQLLSALPDFPTDLLYTTSPSGAVVTAPPLEAVAFWQSWQATPRDARQSTPYDNLWSVITLQRFSVLLQRWGVSPAAAAQKMSKLTGAAEAARMLFKHSQVPEADVVSSRAAVAALALTPPTLPAASTSSYLSIHTPQAAIDEETLIPACAAKQKSHSNEATCAKAATATNTPQPHPQQHLPCPPPTRRQLDAESPSLSTLDTTASNSNWGGVSSSVASVKAAGVVVGTSRGDFTSVTATAMRSSAATLSRRGARHEAALTNSLFGTPPGSLGTDRLEDDLFLLDTETSSGHQQRPPHHPYNAALAVDSKKWLQLSDCSVRNSHRQLHRYDAPSPPRPPLSTTTFTGLKDGAAALPRPCTHNGGVVQTVVSGSASVDSWNSRRGTSPLYVPSPPKDHLAFSQQQHERHISKSSRASCSTYTERRQYNGVFTSLSPCSMPADAQRRPILPLRRDKISVHPYNVEGAAAWQSAKRHKKSHRDSCSATRRHRHHRSEEAVASKATDTSFQQQISNPVKSEQATGADNDGKTLQTPSQLTTEGTPAEDSIPRADSCTSTCSARKRTERVNAYVQSLLTAAASRKCEEAAAAAGKSSTTSNSAQHGHNSRAEIGGAAVPLRSPPEGDLNTRSCRSNASANANSVNSGRQIKATSTRDFGDASAQSNATADTLLISSGRLSQRVSAGVQYVPVPPPPPSVQSRRSNSHNNILQSWETSMISLSDSGWQVEPTVERAVHATAVPPTRWSVSPSVDAPHQLPFRCFPAEGSQEREEGRRGEAVGSSLVDGAALIASTTSSQSQCTITSPHEAAMEQRSTSLPPQQKVSGVSQPGGRASISDARTTTECRCSTLPLHAGFSGVTTVATNAASNVEVPGTPHDVSATDKAVLLVSHTPVHGFVVTGLQLPISSLPMGCSVKGVVPSNVVVGAVPHANLAPSLSPDSSPPPIVNTDECVPVQTAVVMSSANHSQDDGVRVLKAKSSAHAAMRDEPVNREPMKLAEVVTVQVSQEDAPMNNTASTPSSNVNASPPLSSYWMLAMQELHALSTQQVEALSKTKISLSSNFEGASLNAAHTEEVESAKRSDVAATQPHSPPPPRVVFIPVAISTIPSDTPPQRQQQEQVVITQLDSNTFFNPADLKVVTCAPPACAPKKQSNQKALPTASSSPADVAGTQNTPIPTEQTASTPSGADKAAASCSNSAPPRSGIVAQLQSLIAPVVQVGGRDYAAYRKVGVEAGLHDLHMRPGRVDGDTHAFDGVSPSTWTHSILQTAVAGSGAATVHNTTSDDSPPPSALISASSENKNDAATSNTTTMSAASGAVNGGSSLLLVMSAPNQPASKPTRKARPPPLTAFTAPESPTTLRSPVTHGSLSVGGASANANTAKTNESSCCGAAKSSNLLKEIHGANKLGLNRSASQLTGTPSQLPSTVSPTQRLFAFYGVPGNSVMENSCSSWLPAAAGQSAGNAASVTSYNESEMLDGKPLRHHRVVDQGLDNSRFSSLFVPWAKDVLKGGNRDDMTSTHTLPPPREENFPGSGSVEEGLGSQRFKLKDGSHLVTSIIVPPTVDGAGVEPAMPPLLMKPIMTALRDRLSQEVASTILRESTEGWLNLLHSRLSSNGSCVVAFLCRTDNGQSNGSVASASQDRTTAYGECSSNRCGSGSRCHLNWLDEKWAMTVAMYVLRLQRVGRGYLTRRQIVQRYRVEQEEENLDALLQSVLLRGPLLSLPPASAFAVEAAAVAPDTDSTAEKKQRLANEGVASMLVSPEGSSGVPSPQSPATSATPQDTPLAAVAAPPVVAIGAKGVTLSSSDYNPPSPAPAVALGPPLSPFQVSLEGCAASAQSSGSAYAAEYANERASLTTSSPSGSASKSGNCGRVCPATAAGNVGGVAKTITDGASRRARESSPFVTPDNSRYLLPPGLLSSSVQHTAQQQRQQKRSSQSLEVARSNSLSFSREAPSYGALASVATVFNNALLNHHGGGNANMRGGGGSETSSLPPSASRRRQAGGSPPSVRVSFSHESYSPILKPNGQDFPAPAAATATPGVHASSEVSGASSSGTTATRTRLVEGISGVVIARRPSPHRDAEVMRTADDASALPVATTVNEGPPSDANSKNTNKDEGKITNTILGDVVGGIVVEGSEAAAVSVEPIPCWKATSAAAGTSVSPFEGSLFAASGRSGRSMISANSLPFEFSTTAHTVSAMSQGGFMFSSRTVGSLTPAQWTLDGVEMVDSASHYDDGESVNEDTDYSRGSSESDEETEDCNSSSDEDVDEVDAFKRDVVHVEDGGAEPACFGAAAHLLRGERVQMTKDRAVSLLQRVGRGYLCRRHEHFLFMVSISFAEVALLQRVAVAYLARRKMGLEFYVNRLVKSEMEYWELRNRGAIKLHAVVRGFIARQRVKRLQRKLFTRVELRTALELPDPDE